MTRFTLAALAALVLSGCATQTYRDSSPAFSWKSPGGKSFTVSGDFDRKVEPGTLSNTHYASLTVYFNGKVAITGPLHALTYNGTLSGSADGLPVSATCSSVPRSEHWIDVTCNISSEGETIGALRF